jgi:hypothetical protein
MTEGSDNLPVTTRVLAALRELVGALDRRVSHSERPGEKVIVEDSQRLRREAVGRIEELTRTGSDTYDSALVEAIMTDDGGHEGHRESPRR